MFLLKSQFNYKLFRILNVLTGEQWSEQLTNQGIANLQMDLSFFLT